MTTHTLSSLAAEHDKLKAINAELLAMLKLAVKYLDHPDVQTIPFALHADCAASRVHAAIAKAQPD